MSYQGRWQIIVRGGCEAGEIAICVKADGLGEAKALVRVG